MLRTSVLRVGALLLPTFFVAPPIHAQRTATPPALNLTLGNPITFSAADQPLEVVADSSGRGFFVRRQNAENAFNVEHYNDRNRRDWGLPILFGDRSITEAHVVSLPYRDRLIMLAYVWGDEGKSVDVLRAVARKGTKGGKAQAEAIGNITPDAASGQPDVRAITDQVAYGCALTVHLIATKKVVRTISASIYRADPEKLDVQLIDLPKPLADMKVSGMAVRADGSALITVVGRDPATKPAAGDNSRVMYLVRVSPSAAAQVVPIEPPEASPVCLACTWKADGGVQCAGMALATEAQMPRMLTVSWPKDPQDAPAYRVEELDPAQAEALFYTEDMLAQAAKGKDKDAAKHRLAGIARFADRMQPLYFRPAAPDSFLFVGEIQERTETIDHNDMNPGKVPNRSDHLCWFFVGPDGGCARPAVLQKFIGEEGGGSGFVRTKVAYRHGKVYLFFNDNKANEFAEGASVPSLAPGIYVSGPNVMKFADPVLHVEGAEGPEKRIYLLQGRTAKPVLLYGAMSTALTEKDMLLFLSWNGTGSFARVSLE